MCVRISSVRRVLQFTPHNAVSCVLHRSAIRVIHRLQSYRLCISINISNDFCDSRLETTPEEARPKSKEPRELHRQNKRSQPRIPKYPFVDIASLSSNPGPGTARS